LTRISWGFIGAASPDCGTVSEIFHPSARIKGPEGRHA
jgi:hypothetical protein